MDKFDQVLILIPAYNEEENIKKIIDSISIFFKNILIIDDGSSDKTLDIILKSKSTYLSHPINLGQGAALGTGLDFFIKHTDFKYIATFDADGQHSVDDLVEMVLEIKSEKDISCIVGSRFLLKSTQKNIPFIRRYILIFARFYEKIFYSSKFTDAHNGLRVFKRDIVEKLLMNIENFDMAHATEISYKISKSKFKFKEYPINVNYKNVNSQTILNSINIIFKNIFSNKK